MQVFCPPVTPLAGNHGRGYDWAPWVNEMKGEKFAMTSMCSVPETKRTPPGAEGLSHFQL